MTDPATADSALVEEISHRLRSPLTSLTTYLTLMEVRRDRAAREGDGSLDQPSHAELEAAALADALRMADELDRLVARRSAPAVPSMSSIGAAKDDPLGDRRFDRQWQTWDARLSAGEKRLDILKGMKERELAELLAADAGAGRKLERNIIATELTNRLARRARPPSDVLVAAMARIIAHASSTQANTRRLVADSIRTRAEGVERRARLQARREGRAEEGQGEPHTSDP